MNLEERINQTVAEFLESDAIEQKINAQIEKAIDGAMNELFSGYRAPVKEAIAEKLQEQMIPAIEKYDFSRYIVKLDKILTDILKSTTVENKTILENFKGFASFEKPEKVKLSEIFEKFTNHVSKNVSTDGLEIDYDDEPSYQDIECSMDFEIDDSWHYSKAFEYADLTLKCAEDEDMDMKIRLSSYNGIWKLREQSLSEIQNLTYLSEFEVYLINLATHQVPIEIDDSYLNEDVEIEEKPEPTY